MAKRKRIYLCLAHMSEAGLEQKYIKEAFDTNWMVSHGPKVSGFEMDVEDFVNEITGHASTGSLFGRNEASRSKGVGNSAVHMTLINCRVKAGDKKPGLALIMPAPALSCPKVAPRTRHAPTLCGGYGAGKY